MTLIFFILLYLHLNFPWYTPKVNLELTHKVNACTALVICSTYFDRFEAKCGLWFKHWLVHIWNEGQSKCGHICMYSWLVYEGATTLYAHTNHNVHYIFITLHLSYLSAFKEPTLHLSYISAFKEPTLHHIHCIHINHDMVILKSILIMEEI